MSHVGAHVLSRQVRKQPVVAQSARKLVYQTRLNELFCACRQLSGGFTFVIRWSKAEVCHRPHHRKTVAHGLPGVEARGRNRRHRRQEAAALGGVQEDSETVFVQTKDVRKKWKLKHSTVVL